MRRSWLSTGCCRRCWASPISSSPATQQRGLPAQALVFQPKRVLDVASQRVLAIGLTHRSHWLAELGSSKSAIASAVRPALATRRWRRRARSDPSPEGVSTARPSSTFAPPSPWRSPPFAIPATIATARGSSLRPGPPRLLRVAGLRPLRAGPPGRRRVFARTPDSVQQQPLHGVTASSPDRRTNRCASSTRFSLIIGLPSSSCLEACTRQPCRQLIEQHRIGSNGRQCTARRPRRSPAG